MNFDEWFDYQSKMVRIVILFIPVIGWIVEILVRISALIKKKCRMNVVGLVVFILFGWAWLPVIIDMFYLAFANKLMFLVSREEEDY